MDLKALVETGESDAVPEEKTPTQLAEESIENATVKWTKERIIEHGQRCPALHGLRNLRAWFLVGSGFVAAASLLGTFTIKSEMRADRLELKDEFRAIIREEMGEKRAEVRATQKQSAPWLISRAHAAQIETKDAGR